MGVYNLSDGYKIHETLELPSAPLYMAIGPDGRTCACICQNELIIFDTESMKILCALPANGSALSEVEYSDRNTVVYAGTDGIQAWDIKKGQELWTGSLATGICISGDGQTAAGVYRDEGRAVVYDAVTGEIKTIVDFGGKKQQVVANDIFANPNDNLLSLNYDGTLLAVSFADGAMKIFDLTEQEQDIEIFGPDSGYIHFEGGFYQKYFAFSAMREGESVFAVIDTETAEQTGGFQSEAMFSVQTDETGIYVQTDNILVRIDPVTGEQTPMVNTMERIRVFARSTGADETNTRHTLIATEEGVAFFDSYGTQITRIEAVEPADFVKLAGDTALIGNRNSPVIRAMVYENYPDAELFSYDPSYSHDEARISADGTRVMLFSYRQFRIYDINGEMICETDMPEPEQIYDQQFIREKDHSWLEVIYNDGTVISYNAADGQIISVEQREAPDPEMYEEFYVNGLRISSPWNSASV